MRLAAFIFVMASVGASVTGAYFTAQTAVRYLETSTKSQLDVALSATGDAWAEIETDGLLVHILGEAPDEPSRFRVIETIARLVAGDRISDLTTVRAKQATETPDFTLEMLRNGDRVSLIGLVPNAHGRNEIIEGLEDVTDDPAVTDMLDSVEFDVPEHWEESLDLGLLILSSLPRSKVGVRPGVVTVDTVVDDIAEQAQLEEELMDVVPEHLELALNISAPRPVISPFVFDFELEGETGILRKCAAETRQDKADLLRAVSALDVEGGCDVGLGAPSPDWAEAVTLSLSALDQLGAGSLRIENADILLTGPVGGDEPGFEAVAQELRSALPAVFSLTSVLPPPELEEDSGEVGAPPKFTAVRTEGTVIRLRGDVLDETMQSAVRAYAEAQFGFDTVVDETEMNADLPDGWPKRVLTGIEALSLMTSGQLEVTEDRLLISGTATTERIRDELRALFDTALPAQIEIDMNIEIKAAEVRPVRGSMQLYEACADQIDELLSVAQITFPPGSTEIAEESQSLIRNLATILQACPGARFEIGGHTDSQGREESNMALSQARAAAVMSALLDLELELVFLESRGYGETQPIADNETELGRAMNRRIAFTLIHEDGTIAGAEAHRDNAGEDHPEAEAVTEETSPTEAETEEETGSDEQN